MNELTAAPTLAEGVAAPLKLNLACGERKREGYVNVDVSADVKPDLAHDLFRYPWPWVDDSVEEISCEHFIEHIPARCCCSMNRREPFFEFFDECWRIMKPGGVMKIVTPSVLSERAFQDPTHTRFIARATFAYLDAHWRKEVKLSHYDLKCDFEGTIDPYINPDWTHRHDGVKVFGLNHYWNVLWDLVVTLKAVKPARK